MSSRARTSKIALKALPGGGVWRCAGLALLLSLGTVLAARGPLVVVEPSQAPPGSIVICRLVGALPTGAAMAGFHQEAGFYISSRGPVALLSVPLDAKPGHHSLALRWADGESRWDLPVLRTPYPQRQVRVRALRSKLKASQRRGEAKMVRRAVDPGDAPPMWQGAWRWPLDPPAHITSTFGSRSLYNRGKAVWQHKGLDLRAADGTPVLAPADGIVRLAKPGLAATGGTLVLGHGYGVSSFYFHLQRIVVRAGAPVQRGQLLGYSGSSGIASGPHLHWQVELHGNAVDPRQLLERGWPSPMNPFP